MERSITAAIFPAFGCKYLGNEKDFLNEFSGLLPDLLERAEQTVEFNVREFLSCADGKFEDDLQSQYAAYIYSCAMSDIIKRSNISISYAAGYSMGLYAALYHVESISFELGLDLINAAYRNMMIVARTIKFGVGLVSGLEIGDLADICADFEGLEIINVNNRLSFLIAGHESHVQKALAIAREQGALNAKCLPFNSPYHSRFMYTAAVKFRKYLASVEVRDPACPVISTIDQRVMASSSEVINDMADNICHNINWLATMSAMINNGVVTFIECGAGKSLYKMAQFMDGHFRVYPMNTVKKLFGPGLKLSRERAASGVS